MTLMPSRTSDGWACCKVASDCTSDCREIERSAAWKRSNQIADHYWSPNSIETTPAEPKKARLPVYHLQIPEAVRSNFGIVAKVDQLLTLDFHFSLPAARVHPGRGRAAICHRQRCKRGLSHRQRLFFEQAVNSGHGPADPFDVPAGPPRSRAAGIVAGGSSKASPFLNSLSCSKFWIFPIRGNSEKRAGNHLFSRNSRASRRNSRRVTSEHSSSGHSADRGQISRILTCLPARSNSAPRKITTRIRPISCGCGPAGVSRPTRFSALGGWGKRGESSLRECEDNHERSLREFDWQRCQFYW